MDQNLLPHHQLTHTPPLGWNSYDCYGCTVTEAQMKANADAMATKLAQFGYQYVTLDYCWSVPHPRIDIPNPNQDEHFNPRLTMDDFGRLLPAVDRFPSAASDGGTRGLKDLGDYIHGLGLKFGLHIMRGLPRQALAENTPVRGTRYRARDVVLMESGTNWLNHMIGLNMDHPGAQAWYDSLFELYAAWGVDYIKADAMLAGEPAGYCAGEIEAVRKAIDRCGRPIVYSLSPGRAPLGMADHLGANANLWRISGDMWDTWEHIRAMFELCNVWQLHARPGCWPDADMLPLGRLSVHGPDPEPRNSRLSTDERRTLLSLWSIFRSPLIMGGELNLSDAATMADITNPEMLQVNQQGADPREFASFGTRIGWKSTRPDGGTNLAIFNLSDKPQHVEVTRLQLGISGRWQVRDLWLHQYAETVEAKIARELPPHGSALLSLTRP